MGWGLWQNTLNPKKIVASSVMPEKKIRYFNDRRCQRTEYFDPEFAFDQANGSRWMADDKDEDPSLVVDFGKSKMVHRSELAFVRPTAGHSYILEGSNDMTNWVRCGGHDDIQKRSPHIDKINQKFRYLRVRITNGIKGIWEWHIY